MNERRPDPKANMLLLAGLLVFVFLSAFFQVSDCDVGYHLRTAAHILGGNGIPTTNTFSSATPEHPWLLHQWLGTIIFYLPFAAGGVVGLIVFKACIAVTIMLLVWLRARSLSTPGSWAPFWLVTAAAVAARVRFFERPDLLSALFFALLLHLDGVRGKSRRWQFVGLPILMAAWANTHAGVVYGFVLLSTLIAAEWLEWSVERGAIVPRSKEALKTLTARPAGFALSALAACLTVEIFNPNGWRVLWFPISQFTSKFWQSFIEEYQPPTWVGEKAFYLFLTGIVVLQAVTAKRINLRLFLVSAVFGYLGCSSQRSLLFFVIAAAPHAAYMLSVLNPEMPLLKFFYGKTAMTGANVTGNFAAQNRERAESSGPNSTKGAVPIPAARRWELSALLSVWALVVMLVFVPNRTFRFGTGWYHPYYPLEIYQFLAKEVPPQGVFNEMRYGGSMLWWLYPRFKPYIDGRGDAYSETFWLKEYFPVLEAKVGWQDILRAHDLHCVLLPFPESGKPLPLVQALFSDPHWALVAFNDQAVALVERTETNRELIERREFKVLRPGAWTFAWTESPDTRVQGAAETERLLTACPDSRFARTAKVSLLMSSGRFSEAVEELRGILREYPEAGPEYWRDYGYALCRIGRTDTADKVFSRMISKKQLIGFACFMRYHIALERHDVTAARHFLAQALEIEPGNQEYCLAQRNFDQTKLTK